MERIYIEEATELLGYYDRRSVKRWCHNNGVSMFCDNGSNRLYVILEEFNRAKDRKIHQHLQIPLKAIDSNKNNSQYVQVEKQSYTNGPMEPLHIPSGKQWKGLTVYCYRCNTNVSDICKETGKKLNACPFGDRHAFKVYVHVPNKKNERKTKVLATRNVDEAIKQAIDFAKEVKQGSNAEQIIKSLQENDKKESLRSKNVKNEKFIPELLLDAQKRDIERLSNIGVPEHRQEERSPEHIKDVERAFTLMIECLENNGYDPKTLRTDELNDEMVGLIFGYLKDVKKFKIRTRHKYLSHYTSFITRHNQEYNTRIQNLFETIKKKPLHRNPDMITAEEFEKLLEIIKPETGIKEYETGVKPIRNLYHECLIPGIKLGAYTGRRREEIINLKYSDIRINAHDERYILCEDFKVNRIRDNNEQEEKKYIRIPLTNQLFELIKELGYEKYKGTDAYILAPEIKNKRNRTLSDILTRGFTHYYKQLGTGKDKTFKSLRKAYITSLVISKGDNARFITGHSGNRILKDYVVESELMKSAQDFEMFPEEQKRTEELDQTRNNKNSKSLTNEKQYKIERG